MPTRSVPRDCSSPEQMIRDVIGVEMPFSRSVAPIAKASARRVAGTATSGSARATPSSISGSRYSPTSSPICPTSTDDKEEPTQRWPSPRRSRARRGPRSAARPGRPKHRRTNACPQCKQPKLPHRVCANCGYYAGRQAVEVE
jgi:large subunit ribosomal protein L32